ncbi:fatty acid desaturase [bacterium AH-315-P15]|nr:fatty acid desaturase [bacterium AH-315-P15]
MSCKGREIQSETKLAPARDWMQALAPYREPSHLRSVLELAITGISFVVLWVTAWWALSISYWLTLAISVLAAGFLLRLFVIQHDCGHGAFFNRKVLNDWVGRVLGIFSLTPYDVWRRSHAMHHGTSGNLNKRGMGDIDTLTLREYLALPRWRRIAYRLYRHPVVLFGIGPAYNFFLRNRLPLEFMGDGWRYWISTMGTNAALALIVGAVIYLVGVGPFLLVHLPIALLATTIGVWLFYVQHQFDDTYWAEGDEWTLQNSALKGSSYYDLPGVLPWIIGNINVHHVHHLSSRIPYYRLQKVLRDYPELTEVRRLTLLKSLACANLALWDEGRQRLISFAQINNVQSQ